MKKHLRLIAVIIASMSLLFACAPAEQPSAPEASQGDEIAEEYGSEEEQELVEIIELPIFVAIATDEILAMFGYLHEVDYNEVFEASRGFSFDDEGDTLVMWSSQQLQDVNLIGIEPGYNEHGTWFHVAESVFSLEELLVGEALLINNYYGMGTFPVSGISFSDEEGTKYFTMQHDQSGQTDIIVRQFEPDFLIEQTQ